MMEEQKIIVEFSGWLEADLIKTKFQKTGGNGAAIINGHDYIALSEDERDDYILESLITALQECDDNDWEHIDIMVEEV